MVLLGGFLVKSVTPLKKFVSRVMGDLSKTVEKMIERDLDLPV